MALDNDWKPLHVRMGDSERGPFEGIPPHLSQVISEWLTEAMTNLLFNDQVEVLLRLRIPKPATSKDPLLFAAQQEGQVRPYLNILDAVLAVCAANDLAHERYRELMVRHTAANVEATTTERLMAIMSIPQDPPGARAAPAKLRRLLHLGGSVWTVSNDNRSLVQRVDPTVETAIADATKDPNAAASRHLREAYVGAFGINPDAGTSYGKSIRAVESAAWPHVTPQNTKQTLGTMIADLRQAPDKWAVAIPSEKGVERVRSMMELLWQGQIDRHGHENLKQVTPEGAEAAVFLAATLVQWFNSGAIQRTP